MCDEKYIQEKTVEVYTELFGHWHGGMKPGGNFWKIRKFITQIVSDVKEKK